MKTGKVILVTLASIAIGATMGVLLAPDKGALTRKKITKKGKDYEKGFEKKFNKFIDGVSKKYKSIKEEVTENAENGMHKVEEVISKVSPKEK